MSEIRKYIEKSEYFTGILQDQTGEEIRTCHHLDWTPEKTRKMYNLMKKIMVEELENLLQAERNRILEEIEKWRNKDGHKARSISVDQVKRIVEGK